MNITVPLMQTFYFDDVPHLVTPWSLRGEDAHPTAA
jgi:hypothetical protein